MEIAFFVLVLLHRPKKSDLVWGYKQLWWVEVMRFNGCEAVRGHVGITCMERCCSCGS